MLEKKQLKTITDDPLVGRKSTVGGQESQPVASLDSDDEEEVFKDADKEEENEKNDQSEDIGETKAKSGWDHRALKNEKQFDPWARNPSYCGVDSEQMWEMVSLQDHFHPSVALFAKNVIDGEDSVSISAKLPLQTPWESSIDVVLIP